MSNSAVRLCAINAHLNIAAVLSIAAAQKGEYESNN